MLKNKARKKEPYNFVKTEAYENIVFFSIFQQKKFFNLRYFKLKYKNEKFPQTFQQRFGEKKPSNQSTARKHTVTQFQN